MGKKRVENEGSETETSTSKETVSRKGMGVMGVKRDSLRHSRSC